MMKMSVRERMDTIWNRGQLVSSVSILTYRNLCSGTTDICGAI